MRSKGILTYALKNGKLVSVNDVPRGKDCGCTCPACGEPLYARKGTHNAYHFYHAADSQCVHGYESSLHLLAKEILLESRKFRIPAVEVSIGNYNHQINPGTVIEVEAVELEKDYCGGAIRPDVVLKAFNGCELFVEIYVTHKVDDTKLERIRELEISTIEIDLSHEDDCLSKEELTRILLDSSPQKKWIFNRKIAKEEERILSQMRYLPVRRVPLGWMVYDCPQSYMRFDGRDFATLDDQCYKCKYFLGLEDEADELNSLKKNKKFNKETKVKVCCRGHIDSNQNDKIQDELKFLFKHGNNLNCPLCGYSLVGYLEAYSSSYGVCSGWNKPMPCDEHYEFILHVRNHRIELCRWY